MFSWSVPFLAEKVTNMLYNIVKKGGEDEEPGPAMPNPFTKKKLVEGENKYAAIKGKISSVGRMSKMFKTLREQSEMLLMIKNISPDGKLPRGLLLEGRPAIKNGKLS